MNIFNYGKIIILSIFLRKKYDYYGHINDKDYDILIKNINNCGCIMIKCIQWMSPILEKQNLDKNIISKFNKLYNKCFIHDIEYTKQQYKNSFNEELIDKYEICGIIGSGSIGQVYKIKDIKEDKYYVLKVLHPNTKSDIIFFKYLLKIIYNIKTFQKYFFEYCPFNLIDFIDDFYKQIDFVNECNNLLKFRREYKNNQHILIPELYNFSDNIIIMEYIPGTCIDDFKGSYHDKSKSLYLLYLFLRNNLTTINYNHGDLHKYNWAITDIKKENMYKIVIYDYGYCFGLEEEEYAYTMEICDLIIMFDKNNKEHKEKYYNFLRYVFNNDKLEITNIFSHNIVKPEILLKEILKISRTNRLFIKKIKVLNTILLSCLVDNYFEHYNINTNNTNDTIRKGQLDGHVFCETYNMMPELSQIFLSQYKESKQNSNIERKLFESIEFNDKIKALI